MKGRKSALKVLLRHIYTKQTLHAVRHGCSQTPIVKELALAGQRHSVLIRYLSSDIGNRRKVGNISVIVIGRPIVYH